MTRHKRKERKNRGSQRQVRTESIFIADDSFSRYAVDFSMNMIRKYGFVIFQKQFITHSPFVYGCQKYRCFFSVSKVSRRYL